MALTANATEITYTHADSIKVVTLLRDGLKQAKGTNLMIYYGRKLEGTPYVAHTLEVNKTEKLVVNLRQLDCTTFVETVMALSLTTKSGSTRWQDYCRNLELIRYDEGKANGYPSRNHYFYWWVKSNESKGLITMPLDELSKKSAGAYKYAKVQTVALNWMTTHVSSYKMLKDNPDDIKAIRKHEAATSGKGMYYIPAEYTGLSEKELRYVQTGDILALCTTTKRGLDTTHIGIAYWDKDGKLHLLNASQVHKKVILEPMTLRDYMRRHPVQAGIWVIRPTL